MTVISDYNDKTFLIRRVVDSAKVRVLAAARGNAGRPWYFSGGLHMDDAGMIFGLTFPSYPYGGPTTVIGLRVRGFCWGGSECFVALEVFNNYVLGGTPA